MSTLSKPKWPRRRILNGRSSKRPPTSYFGFAFTSSGMRRLPSRSAELLYEAAHGQSRRVHVDIDGGRIGPRRIDALLRLQHRHVLLEDDARVFGKALC